MELVKARTVAVKPAVFRMLQKGTNAATAQELKKETTKWNKSY